MKHIKSFEEKINKISIDELKNHGISKDSPFLISDNEKLPKDTKFKIGDHVKINTNNNEYIYKIEYYCIETKKYTCFITIDTFSRQWIYEDELELVPDYEISSKKFNI